MNEIDKLKLFKDRNYRYDYISGSIYNTRNNTAKSKSKNGYIVCTIALNKKSIHCFAHRLAWFLYYNELPPEFIDHIDRDRTNNKIENLRPTTKRENCSNIDKSKTTSKYIGVSYDNSYKGKKKWLSKILYNGKRIYIGRFLTEDEASIAYNQYKNNLG